MYLLLIGVALSITGIGACSRVYAPKRKDRYNFEGPPEANLTLRLINFMLLRLNLSFGLRKFLRNSKQGDFTFLAVSQIDIC
jgi:hypothetical protein